jgi:hypothetical protein
VEILLRADSHYCAPEVLDFCRAEGLDFILGVASTTTLRRHVAALEPSTAARRAAVPGTDKLRRYKEFYDGAGSWSRVERIIARVEASAQGTDTRFVVTNLPGGSARALYEKSYCQRGQAENHLKAWKRHLAADRTSCSRATANQFRLMLHTAAYWLLWSLRSLMPKRSTAGQARRARRRAEDPGHAAPAQRLPGQGHPAPRLRANAAPGLLTTGADAPAEPFAPQPQNPRSASESRPRSRRRPRMPTQPASERTAALSELSASLMNFAG